MTFIPYNQYSTYLKDIYKERVQKITVLGGFTCPNRDGSLGTKGCTYCNNDAFAPPTRLLDMSIRDQIDHGIKVSKRRYKKTNKYLVYFQSYSNTYAPLERLKELYEEALSHPEVIGLCIGTRPDCIDEEKIRYIAKLAEEYDITIEYGLESMSDYTLEKINRGHDYDSFKKAINLSHKYNIKTCAHLIIGFPWESEDHIIETAKELSKLKIQFLKIHQLHIVKDTTMADEYLKCPFKLLNKEEYMNLLSRFLENLDSKIVIQRIFGESPEHITISERWNLPLSEFQKEFNSLMQKMGSYQGKFVYHSIK